MVKHNPHPKGSKVSEQERDNMRRGAQKRVKEGKHWNYKGGISKDLTHRKKYSKEYNQKYKKIVFDYYGWRCKCCGETTPQFLTIDHTNNDGNLDRKLLGYRLTGWNFYAKIIREGFPDRYQILCMNCNHGKRMNGGKCPHSL